MEGVLMQRKDEISTVVVMIILDDVIKKLFALYLKFYEMLHHIRKFLASLTPWIPPFHCLPVQIPINGRASKHNAFTKNKLFLEFTSLKKLKPCIMIMKVALYLSSEHINCEIVIQCRFMLTPAEITNMQQESIQTSWTNVKQKFKAGAHNIGVIWNTENIKLIIIIPVINIHISAVCV